MFQRRPPFVALMQMAVASSNPLSAVGWSYDRRKRSVSADRIESSYEQWSLIMDRKFFSVRRSFGAVDRRVLFALTAAGLLALTAGESRADATPECNVGPGANSTECGVGSAAAGVGAVAVGDLADASGEGSVVLGRFSGVDAGSTGGVAIGRTTFVNDDSGAGFLSTAAVPDTIGGVAVGDRARVSGSDNVALGGYAVVGVRNSFRSVTDGTAIGAGSNVAANGGSTLGARSQVLEGATNAVAIGNNSIADAADTVSFGAVGASRRLVNVSDGVAATDAATVGQMNIAAAATLSSANAYADAGDAATLTSANAYTDTQSVATLTSANAYADTRSAATLSAANAYADAGDAETLAAANAYTDLQMAVFTDSLESARKRADAGTAAALAVANIPQAFAPGKSLIGAGVGYWRGESAFSIGASHLMDNGRVTFRGSATFARQGGSGGGVGIGFSF